MTDKTIDERLAEWAAGVFACWERNGISEAEQMRRVEAFERAVADRPVEATASDLEILFGQHGGRRIDLSDLSELVGVDVIDVTSRDVDAIRG